MDDLLEGSSTIRSSVSADLFNANTDMEHQHKEASEDDSENDESSAVTSTPTCASKSRVDTNAPKMSILFNQLIDIKVGYFEEFEFVGSQRSHRENFCDEPMIFPSNPTNQNKTMAEKELYTFSKLCILEISIHIIGNCLCQYR